MSYRRLDTLLAVARKGYFVRISCRCGHEVRLDPMKLAEMLVARGGDVRLNRLGTKMKCSKCGSKNFSATHCNGPTVASGFVGGATPLKRE